MSAESLFDQIGGFATLKKVHKLFYDKIYAHPWIGQYFSHGPQAVIESQQTDFMAQAMGGPAKYCGAFPVAAHKHMNISDELFDLRQALLLESLNQAGLSPEHIEKWLRIDSAFRAGIVKKSALDCQKRFLTDEILDFSNSLKKAC